MIVNKLVAKEKSKTKTEVSNENSVIGTLIVNRDGNIIYCSEPISKLLGYQQLSEINNFPIGLHLIDLQGNPFKISKLSEKDSSKKRQFKLQNLIKETFICNCVISKIESGSDYLFVLNISDIELPNILKYDDKQQNDTDRVRQLIIKLEHSEENFKKISQLSSSPVCIQTLEKFLFVNPAWEALTGFHKDEIAFLQCTNIIHSDFEKLIKNRFKAKLDGKKVPEKFDMKILSKSGNEIWVNADLSLVDYQGEQAIMTVLVDITEMKKTQQALKSSRKKFQSLFYENTSIMIVVDPQNGNIVDANESACKFYGYSKAKIITLNLKDISIIDQEEIDAEINAAMHEKRTHFLNKHLLSNNQTRDVEVYSGKVEMKEGVYLYSIVHDITARKEAEEALKKSEQELKQLNAQKDRFFSIIAHDLRGPLGTFMQLTEFMKENYSVLDDTDFEKYFQHLSASAESTFKLLENLLVWTRSQLGAIVFKPEAFNLHQFSNETITILQESANAKKIAIYNKIPKNLDVFADKNTIATVIRNLINNAIKFTNNEGEIHLTARKSKKELINGQAFVEISIKDTGTGIEKENLDKLFRIEKSYSSVGTNNEKGTGLGLILCKELVNKNGGEIWVNSKLNQGSTFSFCLLEPNNSLN